MIQIGCYQTLVAERETDFGFFLSDGKNRRKSVLLPRRFAPKNFREGDKLEVFIALDSEDRPVATTQTPKAIPGEFAMLTVKETTKLGAFLDWGLDKDLLLPFREQPARVETGKSYLVYIYVDKTTSRIAASRRLGRFCKHPVQELTLNQTVDCIVWEKARFGWRLIVNNRHLGLAYYNELCQPLKPGDRFTGFVHAIREDDNRVDIRFRADGIKGVEAEKPLILDALERAGGFLPLNSQSSVEAIQAHFSFSKRTFKQLIGMLYKERAIVITDDGIRLADTHSATEDPS